MLRVSEATLTAVAVPPRTSPAFPFDAAAFRWEGVPERDYKPSALEERGMQWQGLTRHTLVDHRERPTTFDLRYFEIAPGGFSSLEKHEHAHVVVVLRGAGRALVGDEVVELAPHDALLVPPLAPHRWVNAGDGPFGFLCPVDGERDRPQPVDDAEWEALRADPATAPFAF